MLITIGKLVKPFGVKGEMKVEPMTDFQDRFKNLHRVFLVSPAGKEMTSEVRTVRYAGVVPILLFAGYDSPEKAKTLNGWFLKVPQEETVPLPEGTYYQFELIGMDVFSESGQQLGKIVDVFETGSNDVYVMKQGRKEMYIPATKEVVKEINKAEKRMIIRLIDGLME